MSRIRHSLEKRIRAAGAQGRMALIPFITAGFPDMPRFFEALDDLDAAGADIIEIGVPFSDPVADGPTVAQASRRALEQGMTLDLLLRELVGRPRPANAGLVLMGYYNPFLQYGLARFAADAARAGVEGVIAADLPLEESGPLRAALKAEGLALIALVGPNTTEERMREYAESAEGYVYVVSLLGVTGAREGLPPEAEEALRRARKSFALPTALGFGLKEPAQLAGMAEKPDAAVFGSALLRRLEEGHRAGDFLKPWRQNAN